MYKQEMCASQNTPVYINYQTGGGGGVVVKSIYSNGDFDLMTPKSIGFFPFHRAIMWSSLVKN